MNLPEFQDNQLWPKTGPNQAAMECWTVSRNVNAGSSFTLVTNVSDLKRGDVIVLGPSSVSSSGHIAFCDQPYQGSNYLDLLGQNQVNPDFTTGHIPTVTNLNISAFLGAFRLTAWQHGGGGKSHAIFKERKGFPWVLYARKLRGED